VQRTTIYGSRERPSRFTFTFHVHVSFFTFHVHSSRSHLTFFIALHVYISFFPYTHAVSKFTYLAKARLQVQRSCVDHAGPHSTTIIAPAHAHIFTLAKCKALKRVHCSCLVCLLRKPRAAITIHVLISRSRFIFHVSRSQFTFTFNVLHLISCEHQLLPLHSVSMFTYLAKARL